jgi:hypothetical protein
MRLQRRKKRFKTQIKEHEKGAQAEATSAAKAIEKMQIFKFVESSKENTK